MADLKHSKVYRGGITAPYLTIEAHRCSYHPNIAEKALELRFELASKGGGKTSVLLRLGVDDLPRVLNAVAESFPETVIALSDAVTLANRKLLNSLTDVCREQGDNQTRSAALVKELEVVSEFVNEKYYAAPANSDEREAAVKSKLDEVIDTLRYST